MLRNLFNKNGILMLFSVLVGTLVGFIVLALCFYYNLYIFGISLSIFIAPVVSGFVETYISRYLTNQSSGAISSIIMFFVTNGIGWLFPKEPIVMSFFTIGGIFLMIQSLFPLVINYLIIVIFFLVTYAFGAAGSYVSGFIHGDQSPTSISLSQIDDIPDLGIPIFNNYPDLPIREYHGLLFSEKVIDFDEKNFKDRFNYFGSDLEGKLFIKHKDYEKAKRYVLHNLQKEALMINANAIIDVEVEYTNYNQQLPPDVLIAVYGTAVTIDEGYLP